MKRHTVTSWILPPAGFEQRTLWSVVRSANHFPNQTLWDILKHFSYVAIKQGLTFHARRQFSCNVDCVGLFTTPQPLWVILCRLREREKRDRRDSRADEREGQGSKRNRNESEETEEIKTFPQYPYLLQGQQTLPNCKPISAGCPSEVRYTTPSHHPTTPAFNVKPCFFGK